MSDQTYGGCLTRTLDVTSAGVQSLAVESPYAYRSLILAKGQTHEISDLASCTILIFSDDTEKVFRVQAAGQTLDLPGQTVVQLENANAVISSEAELARILIAGTEKSFTEETSVKASSIQEVKRVTKPWGYELWLNGEHPCYAFKEIFIKGGNRTSLQYHRIKQETNIIFDGKAKLHYKHDGSVPNDSVSADHIDSVDIHPVQAIDVKPNTIHRIEAVADILLREVSTPHLDDVVRLMDDAGRGDGRIKNEHTQG